MMAGPSLPQCDMPEQVCRWLKGWGDGTQMADGDALSDFQLHFEHSVPPPTCITSDGNLIWRWIVLCGFFFFMLELTSCLALCEMHWPSFCPREDRGLLIFSVCFVVLILENKAWRDLLILSRLPSYWHCCMYLKAVSLQGQMLHV